MQHSELFYLPSNGQFKSKMDLVLEKVSKITSASLTTRNNFFSTNSSLLLIAYNMMVKTG